MNNRRDFLKNAGLLSLSYSLPGLAAADSTIEIHTGNKLVVLISIFTVLPENEQKFIDLFEEGTLSIFAKQPGYISASLHRGTEAKRLVLYGQWESLQHIDAFRKLPEVGEYFKKIAALATVESVVCNDVPFVHHR
jgi:quinol monooxygenase YgiN